MVHIAVANQFRTPVLAIEKQHSTGGVRVALLPVLEVRMYDVGCAVDEALRTSFATGSYVAVVVGHTKLWYPFHGRVHVSRSDEGAVSAREILYRDSHSRIIGKLDDLFQACQIVVTRLVTTELLLAANR